MTTGARSRWAAVAAIVATAMAVAACGSSSTTTTATSSNSSTAAAPSGGAGTGGAGNRSVTNYLAYVGGKAGKANPSLSPVYIGWINQQGGQQQIGPLATNERSSP
jgi:branched-chain amino acid transport system substrate-binding protein